MFSTTERIFAAVGVIGSATGALIVRTFDPMTAGFFPMCPLFALTGIACPGCGLTRGFHALLNGDVFAALDFNATIPIYAILFVFLFAKLFSVAIRGRGFALKPLSPILIYGFLGVTLIFGFVRNLPLETFRWMMP